MKGNFWNGLLLAGWLAIGVKSSVEAANLVGWESATYMFVAIAAFYLVFFNVMTVVDVKRKQLK